MKSLEEIADKYIKISHERVNLKEYPPKIYPFFNNHFRQIKGWDTDWYDNFHKWREILESKGFRWQQWKQGGKNTIFESVCNFDYYYNVNLEEIGYSILKQPVFDLGSICPKLDPQYCSKAALDE